MDRPPLWRRKCIGLFNYVGREGNSGCCKGTTSAGPYGAPSTFLAGGALRNRDPAPARGARVLRFRSAARRRLGGYYHSRLSGERPLPGRDVCLVAPARVPSVFFRHWSERGLSEPADPHAPESDHGKSSPRDQAKSPPAGAQLGRPSRPVRGG